MHRFPFFTVLHENFTPAAKYLSADRQLTNENSQTCSKGVQISIAVPAVATDDFGF
jgi:hypothetical protein